MKTGSYKEIEGNLITLTNQGEFDVIGHGCNCFCIMGAGLAPQMDEAFGCGVYTSEAIIYRGDKGKLGHIEGQLKIINIGNDKFKPVYVFNMYTQYHPGKHADLNAIRSCMKELNSILLDDYNNEKGLGYKRQFKIGLPQIGCGIGGLQWEDVKKVIQEELVTWDVIGIIFKP